MKQIRVDSERFFPGAFQGRGKRTTSQWEGSVGRHFASYFPHCPVIMDERGNNSSVQLVKVRTFSSFLSAARSKSFFVHVLRWNCIEMIKIQR